MSVQVRQDLFKDILLRPGYISVVAGEPGTGKTFLALKACVENMERGRNSIYFSFNEDADTIRKRLKEVFGVEADEKIEVREAITLSEEGVGILTADLLSSVDRASLVVLDSLDALIPSIRSTQERRTLLQSLYRAVKSRNTSLILISESGDPYLLAGYAADAYFVMGIDYVEERVYRYILAKKTRDIPIFSPYYSFTSFGGFTEVPQLDEIEEVKVERPLEEEHMHLFKRGTRVLIEFDNTIPYYFMNEMKRVFTAYFLAKGNGVMYFTSYDEDEGEVKKRVAELLPDRESLSNLIVVVRKEEVIGGDIAAYWSSFHDERKELVMELKRKTGNKTVISIFSLWFNDLVYSTIGEKHTSTVQRLMKFDKLHGVEAIGFTSTGVKVNEIEKRLADGYFKFVLKHGRVFVYGEKPYTWLYGITVARKGEKWGYEFLPII